MGIYGTKKYLSKYSIVKLDSISDDCIPEPEAGLALPPGGLESIPSGTGKMVYVIQVQSAGKDAGDYASIKINEFQVKIKENSSHNLRGMHIVIVNPKTGIVLSARCFDTYSSSETLEGFINQVPKGLIVIAACKDDCAKSLSKKVKNWFGDMGSKDIWKIKYRTGFAFIGVTGRKSDIKEGRAEAKDANA